MKRPYSLLAIGVTAAATTAAVLVTGPLATAGTVSEPIADGLNGPLQFTFNGAHRPLVAQAFSDSPGVVSRVTKTGGLIDAVTDDGAISGVDYRRGNIAYTLSGGFGPERARASDPAFGNALRGAAQGPYQLLKVQDRNGHKRILANLGRAEANRNPDAHQVYGWTGYQQQCGEPAPGPHAPRAGVVESNPHSVAAAPGGGWYVADAAANVVWKVKDGRLHVVKVFKPRSLTVTPAMADEYELPECAVGTRYNFEPVPTDVEVGPGGKLFVSLLPGEGNAAEEGDENILPSAGMGAVVRVNPVTGRSRLVGQGFTGATNVALAPNRVFVAEMFAGKVTQINTRTGNQRPIAYLDLPASLEYHRNKLYVTYGVFGPGKLAIIDPRGPTLPPATQSASPLG